MTPASYYDFHQPTDFLVNLNDHQDQALLPLCHDRHNHSNDQVSLKLVLSSSSSSSCSSSSSPPPSCPSFFSPCPDQAPYNNHCQPALPNPQEVDNFVRCDYRSYGQKPVPVEEKTETGLRFTIWKEELGKGSSTVSNQHEQGDHQIISSNSFKWMSSKTRIMRKMMKSNHQMNVAAAATAPAATSSKAEKHHHHGDQEDSKQPSLSSNENDSSSRRGHNNINNNFSPNHNDSSSNNDALIRVCADCNTTKTPLWRSGPNGPKSLCNACGIRQRKARRALAAAAAAAEANGSTTTATANILAATSQKSKTSAKLYHHKDKRLSAAHSNGFVTRQKKRSKITDNNHRPSSTSNNSSSSLSRGDDDQSRKLCFEEFAIDLSNKLSLDQVFPQEEKEAAILLMALSCGALVHG